MEEEKMTRYESAKEIYAKLGVDTDAAIAKCRNSGFSSLLAGR